MVKGCVHLPLLQLISTSAESRQKTLHDVQEKPLGINPVDTRCYPKPTPKTCRNKQLFFILVLELSNWGGKGTQRKSGVKTKEK